MSEPTTVTANGRILPLEGSCSLADFLTRQQLLPKSVVVELNGEAVPPSEFPQRQLQPGDRMEIVRIVAGG